MLKNFANNKNDVISSRRRGPCFIPADSLPDEPSSRSLLLLPCLQAHAVPMTKARGLDHEPFTL